jgi:hypothetical protein
VPRLERPRGRIAGFAGLFPVSRDLPRGAAAAWQVAWSVMSGPVMGSRTPLRPLRRAATPRSPALWLGLAAAISGCTGAVGALDDVAPAGHPGDRSHQPGGDGQPGVSTGGGGATSQGAGGGAAGGEAPSPSPSSSTTLTMKKTVRQPLRPMTPFELDNALRELLGDESGAALRLRSDDAKKYVETAPLANTLGLGTFRNLEDLTLVAARAAAQKLPSGLGCVGAEPTGAELAACTETFLRPFLRRAFRRQPTAAELTRYAGIRAAVEPALGRLEAVARMLQAVVMSPSFLYTTALGANDAAVAAGETPVPLSADELAAHLALFLWAGLPDLQLLDDADAGLLADPAGLEKEVDRMLADPRAQNAVGRFVAGWLAILDLATVKKTYPEWSPDLARSMGRASDALVRDWFVKGEAGFGALLDTDEGFVDERLATFYGVSGVTGATPVKVNLADQVGRRGVLGQAAWLAAHGNESGSGPIHRGKWVWEHALCGTPRQVPNDAATKAPAFTPDLTTRQWNESIATSCGGKCHQQMAPLGYVFEDFDGIGRRRDLDNGQKVQTDAEIVTGFDDIDGNMADHRHLATRLAESARVSTCVAEHWLSYALALPADSLDEATRTKVAQSIDVSGREAMRAIATAEAFRLARRTITVPVPPSTAP